MAQRRLKDQVRPRIGVSLDPDVYEWIKQFKGSSDSYSVNRILKAAMLADLKLDDAQSSGVLEDLQDWLKQQKKPSKFASELESILHSYLKSAGKL